MLVIASEFEKRVAVLADHPGELDAIVANALAEVGILQTISARTRVALKPNLGYPDPIPGVTTSPAMIRATVKALRKLTEHICIVESDGGYGAWSATEAFERHGLMDIAKEFGVRVVNLCEGDRESIEVVCGWRRYQIPLPTLLLRETDLFITMPVPKIHAMTVLSLAYKNQWGCIPDTMRLRRHFIFDDAIVAVNRALRPVVLADCSVFLDVHGPTVGEPVSIGYVIAASDAGSFDRYVSETMGVNWRRVPHLRRAAALGSMPIRLNEIKYKIAPDAIRTRTFRLRRTPRDWIAYLAFRSRFFTWLGYESWFGRVVLHAILYAVAGRLEPKK